MERQPQTALLSRASARFTLLGHLLRDQHEEHAWDEVRDTCLCTEAEAPADAVTPLCAQVLDAVETGQAAGELEALYRDTFGHIPAGTFSPYETSYGATNAFTQSQSLADLNGFYRAFGVEPAAGYRERPDHVSLECEFMALLLYKEALALEADNAEGAEVCRAARSRFMEEHIGWWAGVLFDRLAGTAPAPLYRLCGELGVHALVLERTDLDLPDPAAECGTPPLEGIAEEFCPELFMCPDDAGRDQFAC